VNLIKPNQFTTAAASVAKACQTLALFSYVLGVIINMVA